MIYVYVQQYLRLCLYDTGISRAIVDLFCEAKPCKIVTKIEPDTNFYSHGDTTRLLLP